MPLVVALIFYPVFLLCALAITFVPPVRLYRH